MIHKIQAELKAPKSQFNSFGKYKYRSCEDILEAVKPVLFKYGLNVTLSDNVCCIGGRVYIEATAALSDETKVLATARAFAREPESKKGMDESQITGAASSYARKYALNGLFAIDDSKDFDGEKPEGFEEQESESNIEKYLKYGNELKACKNETELKKAWNNIYKNRFELTENQFKQITECKDKIKKEFEK